MLPWPSPCRPGCFQAVGSLTALPPASASWHALSRTLPCKRMPLDRQASRYASTDTLPCLLLSRCAQNSTIWCSTLSAVWLRGPATAKTWNRHNSMARQRSAGSALKCSTCDTLGHMPSTLEYSMNRCTKNGCIRMKILSVLFKSFPKCKFLPQCMGLPYLESVQASMNHAISRQCKRP